MNSKQTILVTGASGSVGQEALKELSKNKDKYHIRALDIPNKKTKKALSQIDKDIELFWGDLTKLETIKEAAQGVDFVIHLAAIIPPLADFDTELAYNVNVNGTNNLITALKESSPEAFIVYSSSISVYGDRVSTPWIKIDDEMKPSVGDYYAETKIEAEKLIKESGLKWSIFRLTAIFGPQTSMDPLFFHMPLETSLEFATSRDTGYAMVKAIENRNKIQGQTFNLSGGEKCRINYKDFISKAFRISGLGKLNFPKEAFAKINFHCGYYEDHSKLQDILQFQRDSIEDYFHQMKLNLTRTQFYITYLFKEFIKKQLLKKSDPYLALVRNDDDMKRRFFGH